MTHLAFTQFMQGRERACAEVATEALELLDGDVSWRAVLRTHPGRGSPLELATWCDLPWPTVRSVGRAAGSSAVHPADLCTRFWLRMRDARLALLTGSVSDALSARWRRRWTCRRCRTTSASSSCSSARSWPASPVTRRP